MRRGFALNKAHEAEALVLGEVALEMTGDE